VRDSIPSGKQVIEQSVFERIGFVVMERNPAKAERKP
jgi:hypothetical protein